MQARSPKTFELFQMADTDHSGIIDREEVSALAKKLGKKLGKKQLTKAMELMDPDGDGEVTFSEFEEWWEKHGKSSGFGGMFSKLFRRKSKDAEAPPAPAPAPEQARQPAPEPAPAPEPVKHPQPVLKPEPAWVEQSARPEPDGSDTKPKRRPAELQIQSAFMENESDDEDANLSDVDSEDEAEMQLDAQAKARSPQAFELFQMADTDHSGFIDREEVSALAKKLGKKLGKKQLTKAMELMDPDGDGEVTFSEFEEWWEKHGKSSGFGGMFSKLFRRNKKEALQPVPKAAPASAEVVPLTRMSPVDSDGMATADADDMLRKTVEKKKQRRRAMRAASAAGGTLEERQSPP